MLWILLILLAILILLRKSLLLLDILKKAATTERNSKNVLLVSPFIMYQGTAMIFMWARIIFKMMSLPLLIRVLRTGGST